jgi:hypothetical protein
MVNLHTTTDFLSCLKTRHKSTEKNVIQLKKIRIHKGHRGLLAAYQRGQYWPLRGPLGGASRPPSASSVGPSAVLDAARLAAAPVATMVAVPAVRRGRVPASPRI